MREIRAEFDSVKSIVRRAKPRNSATIGILDELQLVFSYAAVRDFISDVNLFLRRW